MTFRFGTCAIGWMVVSLTGMGETAWRRLEEWGTIKGSGLKILSLRCLLSIQMDMPYKHLDV